jgi:hypothetical protein
MCFAVSINVLPWSLMFSFNYKCFAVADMGHRNLGTFCTRLIMAEKYFFQKNHFRR